MKKILIVDDEAKIRKLLSRIISIEGYEVEQAEDCTSALKTLKEINDIDLVLCDVKMPDGNGVDLTKQIKDLYPHINIVLLTAYGNIPDGVRAIKNGAYDYLVKGDDNNRLIPLIETIFSTSQPSISKPKNKASYIDIIGKSQAIQQCCALAKKVAPTNTSILLNGSTGTGKEVFARYIHKNSKRANQDLVTVNCAAFSKDMLEGELFGHKAGAFTGAIKDQKGLIEAANNGTLFLDEIGEMPIDLQPKILRVIEYGEFYKIGDTKPTKVDIRVISATNINIEEEIKNKRFREDLYYRLSGFKIQLPSLKDRKEDIPLLANHFLHSIDSSKLFSDLAMEKLCNYNWPGNIRELKNIVEQSIILSETNIIQETDLPLNIQITDSKDITNTDFSMREIERKHIEKVLKYTNGNKAEAARLLCIGIATLYRKIEDYNLK